jgi:hypothetical protein
MKEQHLMTDVTVTEVDTGPVPNNDPVWPGADGVDADLVGRLVEQAGSIALSVGKIETDLGCEVVEPSSPVATSEICVRRIPIPTRGDRRRGPLVPAIQSVLSRR